MREKYICPRLAYNPEVTFVVTAVRGQKLRKVQYSPIAALQLFFTVSTKTTACYVPPVFFVYLGHHNFRK